MKLLCQASQIETCLFILHGSQFGYLQKLICQKRRRLTVMRKQTFTKLFRQCFLAEFAALSGIILFSVCTGPQLEVMHFLQQEYFSQASVSERRAPSAAPGSGRTWWFGRFHVLGEESGIHLHALFESIGSGDLFLWSAGREPSRC